MTKAHENKHRELAELLPWYVNGTLDDGTMEAIDRALETDEELRRNLDRALEDQAATLELAEADQVPASISARFDVQLDQEITSARRADSQSAATPGLLDRVGEWLQETLLAGSRPRLAFVAAAAAIVILLQSGAIISMFVTGSAPGSQIDLASDPAPEDIVDTVFLVQLKSDATIADLSAFLESEGGRIIDGPLPGGMYMLGFELPEGRTVDAIEAELKERGNLFALVLPGK